MFCERCGTAVSPSGKFCSNCGAAVVVQASSRHDASHRISDAGHVENTSMQPNTVPVRTKSRARLEWVLAIIAIPFAVTLFVMVATWRAESSSKASSKSTDTLPAQTAKVDLMKQAAMRELYNPQREVYGRQALCSRIEGAHLEDVRIGVISQTDLTGRLAKPLPAIIARHEFICVVNQLAKKDRITDQWVIMAFDDEFSMIRCFGAGLKERIDRIASECDFRDS